MIEPILKSDKIAIVGGSAGRDLVGRHHKTDWNVWCIARIYNYVLFADYVFEMHGPEKWTSATHKAAAQNKLVLLKKSQIYPNAFSLPLEELTNLYGIAFTSSFSWMVAYAAYRGAKEIALYGINMSHASEEGDQRNGLFYMLGIARASGVGISLPAISKLNQDVQFKK
jgi:hypothetical protein